MTELNPNHPVTQLMHDQWHKLCLMLVSKLSGGHAVISLQDIQATPAGSAIAIQELHDGIHLFVLTEDQARDLARKQGGLPN